MVAKAMHVNDESDMVFTIYLMSQVNLDWNESSQLFCMDMDLSS